MSLCDTCRNHIRSRDICLFADHTASCNTYKCDRYEEIENKPKFISGENPTPVHPTHYSRLNPEPIDVIHSWDMDFDLGNVIKYVARAGYKGRNSKLEDLQKAKYYLEHEISSISPDQS